MTAHSPSDDITPAERRRQIAAILAEGVHRFKSASKSRADETSQKVSDSAPQGLEVPGETRLSVLTG